MDNGKKYLLHYSGAVGVFFLIVFLLMFLAYNEIPAKNKDIWVSLVGVITGSVAAILATIIGKDPEAVQTLEKKVESQQTKYDSLVKQKDELEAMLIKLQDSLIDNMTILGSTMFDSIKDRKQE